MLYPFTKACYDFTVQKELEKPEGYAYPKVSDFKLMLMSALVIVTIELICGHFLYKLFEPFCKEQKDLSVRKVRSSKATISAYKAVYFTFAVLWGYKVLINQYYMPKLLGGSGDFTKVMTEFPYANHADQLKEYLLVTMGYHVAGLINHFIHPRRRDFIEMALHHIVSIYLLGGQYLFNVWEIGAVISLLHDITGTTTYLLKTFSETEVKKPLAVIIVINMILWLMTRLV